MGERTIEIELAYAALLSFAETRELTRRITALRSFSGKAMTS